MKPTSSPPDLDPDLWRELRRAPGGPARLKIFEAYLPFSRRIAASVRRRRPGTDVDMDDLRQYAAEGLLQAIDRFDPDKGAPFEAFASRRVSGCVIDGIGALNEARRQSSLRNRMRAERARSLRGRDPGELSAGDALQALSDLAVELALGFMLDDAAAAAEIEREARSPGAYESLAWTETVQRLAAALDTLPEPETTIIRLHYLEGLEFARIADTLSLSRGRVSQIHASALQRLRKRLPRQNHLHFQR